VPDQPKANPQQNAEAKWLDEFGIVQSDRWTAAVHNLALSMDTEPNDKKLVTDLRKSLPEFDPATLEAKVQQSRQNYYTRIQHLIFGEALQKTHAILELSPDQQELAKFIVFTHPVDPRKLARLAGLTYEQ